MNFCQFQELLNATIYKLFAFCSPQVTGIQDARVSNDIEAEEPHRFTHEQELEIFNVFDTKSDHMIDRDEFTFLCQSWLAKIYHSTSALIVVDVQNDFIDGSLALINAPAGQDGAEVVPVINKLLNESKFDAVVYTQDWHPVDHIAFHDNLHLRKHKLKSADQKPTDTKVDMSNRSISQLGANDENNDTSNGKLASDRRYKLEKLVTNAQVFDIVLFDDGKVEQKLWPRHCIQESWGAELHSKLKVTPGAIRILKGTLSNVDAYSAFWDNSRLNETGLRQELLARGINDLFLCGLALDYCVSASAFDAVKSGFITLVIEDACRGIDLTDIKRVRKELKENGAILTTSQVVEDYFRFQESIEKCSQNVDWEQLYLNLRVPNELVDLLKQIFYRKAVVGVKNVLRSGSSNGKL